MTENRSVIPVTVEVTGCGRSKDQHLKIPPLVRELFGIKRGQTASVGYELDEDRNSVLLIYEFKMGDVNGKEKYSEEKYQETS